LAGGWYLCISQQLSYTLRIARRLSNSLWAFPSDFPTPFEHFQAGVQQPLRAFPSCCRLKRDNFQLFFLKGHVSVDFFYKSKEHLKILKTTSGSSSSTDPSNNTTFSQSQSHATVPLMIVYIASKILNRKMRSYADRVWYFSFFRYIARICFEHTVDSFPCKLVGYRLVAKITNPGQGNSLQKLSSIFSVDKKKIGRHKYYSSNKINRSTRQSKCTDYNSGHKGYMIMTSGWQGWSCLFWQHDDPGSIFPPFKH
jgi:hypothetical protein